MSAYDVLLQPFQLRGLTLRNRIVSTAHAPGYSVQSLAGERYRLYHVEKAKGGVALTMIGGSTAVSTDSAAPFGQLTLAEDRAIPHIKSLVDAVHDHGAAVFCQISHAGRRGRWDTGAWMAPVSPSAVREAQHRSFPREMEDWDFERILHDFQAAGQRAEAAGLDGIELLFAGGQIGMQFLSPAVNKRTDQYGGSLENRLRFPLQIIDAVRRGLGDRLVLGVRITADEFFESGLDQEDCLEIAKAFSDAGAVDYLNIMASTVYNWRTASMSMPSMGTPLAPYLDMAGKIKAAVSVPVLHANRILDFATAARAVEDGLIDLVGMTRAQIADPHMVRKLTERRESDIRPCVGANYCISRIYAGGEALCIQNPATGREATMPHVVPKADTQKRVVVVGAGPAGLEAARVSAERGHKVTLIEAEPQVGGQINIASKVNWRQDLQTVSQWLEDQCRKLGVDIWLGYMADSTMIEGFSPDIVVVATGGFPNVGDIEGAEHVYSTWDILGGRVEIGERVLMFDDQGADSGISGADHLSQAGKKLEVVTPERHLGVEAGAYNFPVYLSHLYKNGVSISPDRRLLSVKPAGNSLVATLRNEYTLEEETREVDQVVSDNGTLPNDELYLELKERSLNQGAVDYNALMEGRPQATVSNPDGKYMLFRVGDAVASRNIHAALFDSLRLCKDF
ncbi:FAD-dependent oxidoreductase [Pseudaminobacter sp. 19-2017]|uniref:FAD-dependent oxidoreductase n=1 Tax=Pseudaminobacter soli (ex Zhang et al. 2022) TaxID=2831468 RepID=A0A942IA88_9HYPH|nr:NADH:flavin oxidoreductase [Pseudaminobacter soli]MBS3650211.1 FAD-dependent oxidoreductase [Pseudaminobacter soli]